MICILKRVLKVVVGIILISTLLYLTDCLSEKIGYEAMSSEILINKIIKDSELTIEPSDYNIQNTLEALPHKLLAYLVTNNIKIEITDKLGPEGQYGTVTSNYVHKDRIIYVQKTYSNADVLLHEIGHAYSYNKLPILKISNTLIFNEIYKKEKDKIFPDGGEFVYSRFSIKYEYVKSNPEEYFAQCFCMYINKYLPEDTETYKYIDSFNLFTY